MPIQAFRGWRLRVHPVYGDRTHTAVSCGSSWNCGNRPVSGKTATNSGQAHQAHPRVRGVTDTSGGPGGTSPRAGNEQGRAEQGPPCLGCHPACGNGPSRWCSSCSRSGRTPTRGRTNTSNRRRVGNWTHHRERMGDDVIGVPVGGYSVVHGGEETDALHRTPQPHPSRW
jgi:hypothetical protein